MCGIAPDRQFKPSRDLQLRAAVLDALGQAVVSWDLAGRITYANRAAARLFGRPDADAMAELRIDDLLPPLRPVGDDASAITDIARRGESWSGDARFAGPDGQTFVAALIQRPLLGDDGHLTGAVAIITDTSDQRQAENMLRMRDQQLRTLMAHAPVIMWTVDKAGIMTYCEGAGLQKLGLSGGDFVGTPAFAKTDYAPYVAEHHRRALAGETFSVAAAVGGRKFEVHYSPLRQPRGAITGAMALAIDVTPRREAEAAGVNVELTDIASERRNADLDRKLRAATSDARARDRESVSAAHELRSPLTVIRGLLSTITEYHERLSVEEILDMVARSQDAVVRLDKLVSDLLLLSKLDAGDLPRPTRIVSLRDILAQALDEARIAHPERDFVLRAVEGEARVRGDGEQLRDVIASLLDNAVNYSPEATPIEIDVASGDGTVAVTIRDRGPGVPAGELDRIFSRFHRVRTARNATVAGAGIGLAVCRALVERHGGQIEASKPAGGGLAVTFTLPLAARKPKRI